MTTTNTGGSAFPHAIAVGDRIKVDGGMTLRDYFAAKAMAACITALGNGSGLPLAIDDELLSERAYEIADAMLKAPPRSRRLNHP